MAIADTLKLIRLSTTEEILGEIKSETDDTITVANPIRVVIVPSKTDPKNPQVAFAPFAEFTDDKEFVFNRSQVVTIYTPIAQFVNQYNSLFGGIVIPESKIITP